MKNKTQDEYFSNDRHHSEKEAQNKRDISEARIRFYRKAWLDGTLQINSEQLAQKIIDFEKQINTALPDAKNYHHKKH